LRSPAQVGRNPAQAGINQNYGYKFRPYLEEV
jgi:hypothetical protein